MADIQKLKDIASQVRRDIIRQTFRCQSGHPGGSLGCADLMVALYFEILHHNPAFSMQGSGEDLFFLSNGHISPVWYSVLARSGYFPVEELATFRQLNSRLQGHPATHEKLPGVRVASGSLGQGMSVAIGAALGKKLDRDERLVYCLVGDGELQEGQVWEAALFAAHHGVDNLIVICDRNNAQIDGTTEDVIRLGEVALKFRTFGWHTLHMDGNDMSEVVDTLLQAAQHCGAGKPVFIEMKTAMGKGVDFMEGNYQWHGKPPSAQQTEVALAQLAETLGDF